MRNGNAHKKIGSYLASEEQKEIAVKEAVQKAVLEVLDELMRAYTEDNKYFDHHLTDKIDEIRQRYTSSDIPGVPPIGELRYPIMDSDGDQIGSIPARKEEE